MAVPVPVWVSVREKKKNAPLSHEAHREGWDGAGNAGGRRCWRDGGRVTMSPAMMVPIPSPRSLEVIEKFHGSSNFY